MTCREQIRSAFSSLQLLLCFLADRYSLLVRNKHPQLSGTANSHIIMHRESVNLEFREGTVRMARLCLLRSETSAEKVQRAGSDWNSRGLECPVP